MSHLWSRPFRAAAACALAAFLVLGCSEASSGPGDPQPITLTFLPATQWAGGTVQVSTPLAAVDLPTVQVGGRQLGVVRLGSTTVAISLPDTATGDVTLYLSTPSGATGQGVVHVVGLDHATPLAMPLGFDPLPIVVGGQLKFVADSGVTGDSRLAMLDAATAQVTIVHGIGVVQSGFGVLAGYQPGQVVAKDSTGAVGAWTLAPLAQAAPSPVAPGAARLMGQLADTVWLSLTASHAFPYTPAGKPALLSLFNDPLRLIRSPAGNRYAVVIAQAVGGRAPLFDAAGDTVASYALQNVQGAAFSSAGDTLFAVGRGAVGAPDTLVAVASANGQRLAAMALPAGLRGYNLALDPSGQRLYQVSDSSGAAGLLVWNPATLTLVGRMTAAGTSSPNGWSAGIAADAGSNRVYVAYPGAAGLVVYGRIP